MWNESLYCDTFRSVVAEFDVLLVSRRPGTVMAYKGQYCSVNFRPPTTTADCSSTLKCADCMVWCLVCCHCLQLHDVRLLYFSYLVFCTCAKEVTFSSVCLLICLSVCLFVGVSVCLLAILLKELLINCHNFLEGVGEGVGLGMKLLD